MEFRSLIPIKLADLIRVSQFKLRLANQQARSFLQRSLCRQQRKLGKIVFLAEVSQYNVRGLPVIVIPEKLRDRIIGKMPAAAHDPLFKGPGIRSNFKHLDVMIRLQNNAVSTPQTFKDEIRKISQVQCDPDFYPALFDYKT